MPVPPSRLPPSSASPPTLRSPEVKSARPAEVNPTTSHRRSRPSPPAPGHCRLAGLPIRGAWTAGGAAAYRLDDIRGLRFHVRGRDDPPGVLEGEGQVDGGAGQPA